MNIESNLILLLFSIISCATLTRFAISFFTKLQILDIPNERRAHNRPTPRCGGTAIVLTLILGLALYDFITPNPHNLYSGFSIPLILAATISLFDDIKPIQPILRFIAHLAIAAFVIDIYLPPKTLFHNELPILIDYIMTIIALTAFMNVYNFMDGIDGITSTQSIHLSMTIIILCLLHYNTIIRVDLILSLSIITLGSSIAFLYFNWPPAKIFLGDVGSISLGLINGICLILIAASEQRLFLSAIIASLYYIADGGGTILIRLAKKEKIWLPHLNHFFQQANRKGMNHKTICSKIALCNFILMMLSIGALYYPIISFAFALLTVMIILIHFSR
jgi:UDP-N-acetylmuramyl pentapeptide phosphotransferase/UDP-N-acetylglucosamine-1-phosphate transferase